MTLWKQRLLARLYRRPEGDLDAGGDGGGSGDSSSDFNMDAAVAEIGLGLGFKSEPPAPAPASSADPAVGSAPSPSPAPAPPAPPAPTPAPTAAPVAGPAPAPAPVGAPAPSASPAPASGGPARFTAEAAPSTWSQAAAADWANLPLSTREEIARRENNMFTGLEAYKSDAQVARDLKPLLDPIQGQLQQVGMTKQQFLGSLVQAHFALGNRNTPVADRMAIAKQLMGQYGLSFEAAAPAEPDPNAPYIDPQVTALQTRLDRMETERQGELSRQAAAARQAKANELQEFADKNPEFYDVADDIALLIRGSGGTMSVQEAFNKARLANPVIRAKEQERIAAEAVAKAQKEAEARAEEARKATAARVKTRGHQGGGTATAGTMEDTMKATLAAIRKRENK